VTGLVLAGGGARGAYEAGALSVLLPALAARGERPTVLVGSSVGAINAAFLAAVAHLPAREAAAGLVEQWRRTGLRDVMNPLPAQAWWLLNRGIAGLLPTAGIGPTGLLNPEPTRDHLRRCIDWAQLRRNIDAGQAVLAVIATDVGRERAVVFCDGKVALPSFASHLLDYVPVQIGEDHVRASAAIPVLFPAVRVEEPPEARGWYVDGSTRLNTPIKPALDLQVDRVVVVSTAAIPSAQERPPRSDRAPNLGDGALNMLHSRLVDPLVEDMRALGVVNSFFAGSDPGGVTYRRARGKPSYRQVPYIFVAPQHHSLLGGLAQQVFHEHYRGFRSLRNPELAVFGRVFGARAVHGELFSYLFFAPEYIDELLALGAADAQAWLQAPPGPDDPWQVGPLDALAIPDTA
jgi:NTE family protein